MPKIDNLKRETKAPRHDLDKRTSKTIKSISWSDKLLKKLRWKLFIRSERKHVQINTHGIQLARKR